jgi:ABC-type histidine transport system ATPase subunit
VDTLKTEAELIALRKRVGFVFQQYNLFPHLTVLENLVIAPTRVVGHDRATAEREARALLDKVRLGHKERPTPASSRAASSSAWRLRAGWPCSPSSCCSTRSPRRWIRRPRARC